MSQNSSTDKAAQMAVLSKIHSVEGFDPTPFAVEYTDLNTNEKRKRLPVMAQMAWFRLVYPEGKIAIQVTPAKDCFVASARVYPSYKDPVECYLAEATASRSYDPNNPTVSPREWAQTAAVGIALRNAGFGLQFGAAGDDFNTPAVDELGAMTASLPPAPESEKPQDQPPTEPESEPAEPERELTMEERYQLALNMPCPIRKYKGRTLGDVLPADPNAIKWIANKYSDDPEIMNAARTICEYAVATA